MDLDHADARLRRENPIPSKEVSVTKRGPRRAGPMESFPSGRLNSPRVLLIVCVLLFQVLGLFSSAATVASDELQVSRIVVQKKTAPAWTLGSPFVAVASGRPALAGFTQLADYPSRAVFEGPKTSAQSLMDSLRSEGYETWIAADLDDLAFLNHRIDPDTGEATPPFPVAAYQPSGTRGLFILTLRSYPTPSWFADLNSRGVRLIESLSPAAYVARMGRSTAATLKEDVNFVRSVFPIRPAMKVASSPVPLSDSPFRHVIIHAVESEPHESLTAYLESVSSQSPALEERLPNGKAIYAAWLSDLDLRVLSLFESVYSLVEVPTATLSSERQGLLVLNPSINQWTGGLELPTTLPGSSAYWEVLNAAPISISNFSNTKVAIIDTGFDDGMSVPSMHPDFQLGGPSVETLLTEFGTDTSDTQGHGTLTASIISGFTAQGARADAENFRFALGLSPGVKIISDKFFGCGSSGDLTSATHG